LDLDEEQWLEVLRSHAMTAQMAAAFDAGHVGELLDAREEAIAATTREFLERMIESRFEDTPPLATLDLDEPGEEPDPTHAGA
jgi:hypothetical protein